MQHNNKVLQHKLPLLLQPFYRPLSGTTQVSQYQKDKPFWILLKQTRWGGSGMQAICTSLQKITTPAPHHSDFYGSVALPDTQTTASKHWRHICCSKPLLLLLLLHCGPKKTWQYIWHHNSGKTCWICIIFALLYAGCLLYTSDAADE